jgi:hypothetical protein
MYIVSCVVPFTGVMLLLLSVGVVCGVSLWSHHRPYPCLPQMSHCRSSDPRDCRSFCRGGWGGQEEHLGFWPTPFIIDLRSALEEDRNLWSLLPARCCRKAHTSTGSSLYSSSELLYIGITFFGASCPYLFLVACFLLGARGLAANLGFSSCCCPGVGRSNSPLL